jgi:hypothetical protein
VVKNIVILVDFGCPLQTFSSKLVPRYPDFTSYLPKSGM